MISLLWQISSVIKSFKLYWKPLYWNKRVPNYKFINSCKLIIIQNAFNFINKEPLRGLQKSFMATKFKWYALWLRLYSLPTILVRHLKEWKMYSLKNLSIDDHKEISKPKRSIMIMQSTDSRSRNLNQKIQKENFWRWKIHFVINWSPSIILRSTAEYLSSDFATGVGENYWKICKQFLRFQELL